MEILNHHVAQVAACTGLQNPILSTGSSSDHAYWEVGPRCGHIDLFSGRVTEFCADRCCHFTLDHPAAN